MTRTFEEARRIPFFPSYCVTESGRIGRIGSRGWLAPQTAKRGGYLTVTLWSENKGHTYPIHRIVAITFIGPPPSEDHEVAHNDGIKPHCHWGNLRWATHVENERDKVAHGKTNRGGRNGMAKLTDEQVAIIIARSTTLQRSSGGKKFKKGELPKLANEYGVTASAVYQIVSGRRRVA